MVCETTRQGGDVALANLEDEESSEEESFVYDSEQDNQMAMATDAQWRKFYQRAASPAVLGGSNSRARAC